MLEKIMNSMIHGNAKTKAFLWLLTCMFVGAVILLLAGIVLSMPYMLMGGIAMALVGVVVSQSVSLKDLQKPKNKKNKKAKSVQDKSSEEKKEKESGEIAQDELDKKEKKRAKSVYLSGMDAKKMKNLMKKHKVNQVHVKVMIDSYPAKGIEQAPAFMWKTDTMLHFMVLEDKAIEFEVPLDDIKGILLVKNVSAEPEKDYLPFQYSTFISKMFQPYLPEYFETTKEGKLLTTKNTFRIEPGIYLTNSSVTNLRKVLLPYVAFQVDDQVIASKRFNEYFKEIYRASILCKNQIISLEEYKEQIKKTLDALLDAPVTGTEFVNTIYDLNKYHLISKNDVVLYTQRYRELKMNG